MTFQYIINHLDKPHLWYIVLTGPHAELSTKKKLEQQGHITYVPLVPVRRSWAGYIKAKRIYHLASSNHHSFTSKPININQRTETDNYPQQYTLYKRLNSYCFQDITRQGSADKEQSYCQCFTSNTIDSRTNQHTCF